MSFIKFRTLALFLATSCAVAGAPVASQATNSGHGSGNSTPIEAISYNFTAKPATASKPGAGAVGTTSPRGGVGTTTRGRTGRSK
jgi:hypothetical protein